MINKYLLVILLFGACFLFIAPYMGVTGLPMVALLTAIFVGVASLTKVGNVFKLSRMYGLIVIFIPLFILGLYTGWWAAYGITTATLGLEPLEALVIPTAVVPTEAQAACRASVKAVNPNIVGDAATLVLSGWDVESLTAYTSTVDIGTDCWIYVNGNGPLDYAGLSTATSATAHTALANVGDIVYVYCGGTSYYTEPIEAQCIDQVNTPVNLLAHAIAAESNIALTCFDNTGAVGCSAADNTTNGDYDITLGANGDDSYYVRVKNNVAVKAFNFGGFAVKVSNDIDDAYPITGSVLTSKVVPKFLKGLAISPAAAGGIANNFTSANYNYLYQLPAPILLSQWQYQDFGFIIEGGGTDPAETNVFNTGDSVITCVVDSQYAKGSDGTVKLLPYADTLAQANVGITEDILFPVGKTTCMVLYGI